MAVAVSVGGGNSVGGMAVGAVAAGRLVTVARTRVAADVTRATLAAGTGAGLPQAASTATVNAAHPRRMSFMAVPPYVVERE
jgi:hypothetical protein